MIQYVVYFVAGFLLLYQLLLLWGMSARVSSPGPYFGLLGGLLIFPFAAAASLNLPRLAAWAALAGGVIALFWPISGMMLHYCGPLEALLYAALPLIVTAFSLHRIAHLREEPPARPKWPPLLAVVLTALPFLLFFALFNWIAILGAILAGPPPWPHSGAG